MKGAYHDPVRGSISQQIRERKYPIIGSGRGVYSFVHVEDAAAATVAALGADPGVYNVVDDNPLEAAIWLPAFAQWLGAAAPPHVSEEDARRTSGPDAVYYAMHLRGAANARAKRELRFRPRILEWLNAKGESREFRYKAG